MTPASAQNDRGLVVFGEFFLDLVFYDLPRVPRLGEEVKTASFARFPGGGLATTALVASQLGTPTKIVTRVGRDVIATSEWQMLVHSNVSCRGCEFDRHQPTAMTVCAAVDGDRMMITQDAINQNLEKLLSHRVAQHQIRSSKHLHLACSLWPPQRWLPAIRKLRRHGPSLSLDIGWNLQTLQSKRLPTLLKEFEFIFPNEAEAKAMTGDRSVEAAAKKLARWVRVPIIKLGPAGSLAVRDGKILRIKSIRVRTVDATGCGDAFNGGFLHGYVAGWSLEDCLRAGNVCGALAATCPGGSSAIPTPKRLRKLMEGMT
jgi:sugar/nucleoside kinase (ribokinase family)